MSNEAIVIPVQMTYEGGARPARPQTLLVTADGQASYPQELLLRLLEGLPLGKPVKISVEPYQPPGAPPTATGR